MVVVAWKRSELKAVSTPNIFDARIWTWKNLMSLSSFASSERARRSKHKFEAVREEGEAAGQI